jgi:hypothetical protein
MESVPTAKYEDEGERGTKKKYFRKPVGKEKRITRRQRTNERRLDFRTRLYPTLSNIRIVSSAAAAMERTAMGKLTNDEVRTGEENLDKSFFLLRATATNNLKSRVVVVCPPACTPRYHQTYNN